jgi:hypothetical protein
MTTTQKLITGAGVATILYFLYRAKKESKKSNFVDEGSAKSDKIEVPKEVAKQVWKKNQWNKWGNQWVWVDKSGRIVYAP